MTTSRSPLKQLKKQADFIASMICAVERGDPVDLAFEKKVQDARNKECLSVGVVMDDKTIVIDLPWAVIKETGQVALGEYILKLMKGSRDDN